MSEISAPSVRSLGAGRVRLSGRAGARDSGSEWRRAFVEDFGELDLVPGMPRASMRVLGWMVVCRPALQSAPQIMDQLALSAGSVSTAVNALHDNGLLERVARAGDRRAYYRLSAQGWENVLEARLRTLGEVRRAADRALQAARGQADDRLWELRDTHARVEAGLAELLRRSRVAARAEGGASTRAPRPVRRGGRAGRDVRDVRDV
jgi:DNA-binding transcriptional regulator GbsR (MarR family)